MKFKLEVMESWPALLSILKHKHQSFKYSFILKMYMRLMSGFIYIAADTLLGVLSIVFITYFSESILDTIH